MSQELGVAALIERIDLDANSATSAMRNGISATNPLIGRRDSAAMGKFDPSPATVATANHEARKAPITNGTTTFCLSDSEVLCAARAAIPVCAATMNTANATMRKPVPRCSESGREISSVWIIVVYTTMIPGHRQDFFSCGAVSDSAGSIFFAVGDSPARDPSQRPGLRLG